MNRTTKAMARLGTLAVIAGTVLSTPFALGVANAATLNPTVSSTIGVGDGANTVTAAQAAALADPGGNFAETVSVNAGMTAPITLQVNGSAYIPTGAYTGSGKTITCATVAQCTGVHVYDNVAESAGVGVSDSAGNTGTATVNYNNITFPGCPQNDYDTAANCLTQGQVGTQIPITVHYGTGNILTTDQSGRVIVLTVNSPSGDAFFVGGTAPFPGTSSINCTTDASGNCTVNFVDNNPLDTSNPSVAGHLGPATITAAMTAAQAFPYPGIGTVVTILGVQLATAGRVETVDITEGSVAPARLDLISSTLIKPDAQDSTATAPEPGDVIQNVYKVTGSCTPTAGNATCTGETLTGVSVPLTVDHGFFTPNCSTTQTFDPTKLTFNLYGSCSFSTAPAAGGQVGNLTNSGQTITATSNLAGEFVVSLGIARDTAFDSNGVVVAHVKTGSIPSTTPNTLTPPTPAGERTTAQTCTASKDVYFLNASAGSDFSGCPLDFQWTTREQPLNGGTAKYLLIDGLAAPNTDSINTENNFGPTQKVSDTGTSNVPDTDRVVFSPQVTDQFGNLVSFTTGSATVTLTKTGVGSLGQCTGSSATDPCTGATATPGAPGNDAFACTAQSDGTYKDVDPAVEGSYLNLPVGVALGSQTRYQADDTTQNCGVYNDGYNTGFPGVNDGTQTDVLSWAPPVTTFKQNVAGVWTYSATTGAAQTDTLTLNFYNQLAQPVVTFTVTPGNTVPTSTAVTVTAKVVDQFGNPIVGRNGTGTNSGTTGGVGQITVVRSGSNEASCVPAASTGNGGAPVALSTNTSGVAGYTFSCNAPGVSTVSMVVTGPGGTQLASGKEAITFTGPAVHTTVERPTVHLTSVHKHHLTVVVHTSPALGAARTVNIYRVRNGLRHLVGQTHTGPRGNASLSFSGLRSGATWSVSAKVINLGTQYRSEYSVAVSHRIK
ncbi:MAG TPA: hypothetical protein VHB69_09540 [Mycobacteriales bacterium]|nr:hypothetical protein [Mycobacteriales bacterium]